MVALVLLAALALLPPPAVPQTTNITLPPNFLNFSIDSVAEGFKRRYIRELRETCLASGHPFCCGESETVAFVKGMRHVDSCVPAYSHDACFEHLMLSLHDPTNRSQFSVVPPGFYSPDGFSCVFRCGPGAFCPSFLRNPSSNFTGTAAERAASPICADRRLNDQMKILMTRLAAGGNASAVEDIEVVSYCCRNGMPPHRPSFSDFPFSGPNEDICLSVDILNQPCPPGFYCPDAGAEPIVCPSGSYCPLGAEQPIACFIPSMCAEGSERRSADNVLPIVVFLVVSAVTIAVYYTTRFCLRMRGDRSKEEALDKRIAAAAADRKRQLEAGAEEETDNTQIDVDVLGFRTWAKGDDGSDRPTSPASPTEQTCDVDMALAALEGSGADGDGIPTSSTPITTDNIPAATQAKRTRTAYPTRQHGVGLVFRDLTVQVRFGGPRILTSCSGSVLPGQLTALMGNSGCGKSSLLNVLSDRASYARVLAGRIDVLPAHVTPSRRNFGFVPQEDIFHRALTVRELFSFQAALRLPTDWTPEQREQLIDDKLELLKLEHVQHRVVGGADGGRVHISGGQSRRVSIGMELMANPDVLALDEPTSGLDAAASFSIIESLQAEARHNHLTVVCIIHQPRQEIFEMFDNVLLLCEGGRPAYNGRRANVVQYFEALGFAKDGRAPNPADFVVDSLNDRSKIDIDQADAWEELVAARAEAIDEQHAHGDSVGNPDDWVDDEYLAAGFEAGHAKSSGPQLEADKESFSCEQGHGVHARQSAPAVAGAGAPARTCSKTSAGGGRASVPLLPSQLQRSLLEHNVRYHLLAKHSMITEEADEKDGGADVISAEAMSTLETPRAARRHRHSSKGLVPGALEREPVPWVRQLVLETTRAMYFLYHRLFEVLFDHVLMALGAMMVGVLSLYPTYNELPTALVMVNITIGVSTTAIYIRTFSREERVFWRERACGLRLLPSMLGVMLVDLLSIMTLSLLASATLYATFSPQMAWVATWKLTLGLVFSYSGLSYFVSSVASKASGNLVAASIVAIFSILSGVTPTLTELDSSLGTFGAVLYTPSSSKWFVEGMLTTERDYSPRILHFPYDTVLSVLGYEKRAEECLGVLIGLGMGWRCLSAVIFATLRRSSL